MTRLTRRRWWQRKTLDEIITEHIADHRLRLLDAEHRVETSIANRNATRDAIERLLTYRRQLRWSDRQEIRLADPPELHDVAHNAAPMDNAALQQAYANVVGER